MNKLVIQNMAHQVLTMKNNKTNFGKLKHQNKVRTLGENETYKYLGTLPADTIKRMQIERQNSKGISQEN